MASAEQLRITGQGITGKNREMTEIFTNLKFFTFFFKKSKKKKRKSKKLAYLYSVC